MRAIIDVFRRIVDRYEEKHNLRKKTTYMCHNWDTRNRYKLEEWKTKKGEPLCTIYKDDRCCGSCELAATCDHAVNCGCFGFAKSALGGTTESMYMRKSSPYYKYGRMKPDGSFDWDYYKLNQTRAKFSPGKYTIVSNYDMLKISEEMKNQLKEKELSVGTIFDIITDDKFVKLNFNENGRKEDFVLDVSIEGLDSSVLEDFYIAKQRTTWLKTS